MNPASLQSAFGLLVLMSIAWALSENRRAVSWRLPVAGVAIQILVALLFLKLPFLKSTFNAVMAHGVGSLNEAMLEGSGMVFGYLGGNPAPFEITNPAASFILAFQALPLVLIISALTAMLNHWGILGRIVQGFSWLLERSLKVGGAVGLAAAANIFVGMVEAPLFIRPYLSKLTRAEMFVVMVSGMATIAGTMLVVYASILAPAVPGVAGHLVVASVISAPAAIVIARLMVPDRADEPSTVGHFTPEPDAGSTMDALTKGTENGLRLYLNILAMLIVLVALVSLLNTLLALLPAVGDAPVTLQRLVGLIMAPVTWLMGIPWAETGTAGTLMGVKAVLNEFLAYLQMASLPDGTLSDRSTLILTYAMCGFANPASLGIMIGGLAAMAPDRRPEIAALGLRSVVAGLLATSCTGAVIGILV